MSNLPQPELRVLADGRKIVRRKARDRTSGNDFFQYRPENNRESVGDSVSLYGDQGFRTGPGEEYQRYERACRPGTAIELRAYDPLADEIHKLSLDGFPQIARWIDSQREKTAREADLNAMFDTGDFVRVSAPTVKLMKIDREELVTFLARHSRGDFGLYGEHQELADDSDERWAPPYFDRAVQNSAAISDKSGIIQSRYSVFRADDPTKRRNEGSFVLVTTLLSPGRVAQTAITCSIDIV